MPTILLIDDDADFVEATCTVLESAPYEVLAAYNGEEGLAIAREMRPDLIILDVIMPVEDGFQVLRKLRAEPTLAHIPVMILSSLPNGLDVAPASEADATAEDYVDKPVRPVELLRRVEKLLEQHSTQRAARNTK